MRVIVGVDGTALGMETLETALEEIPTTELTVAVYGGNGGAVESTEQRVRERLRTAGVEARVERLDSGNGSGNVVGGELVERAERADIDRIVLPGGTRSPLGKIRFDDTAEFVLLNAGTSVTLVR